MVRKSSRLHEHCEGTHAEGVICPRSHTSFSKPHGWVGSSVRQLILRRLLWEIGYGAQEEARTVGRQEVPASATPLKRGIWNRRAFPLRPCSGQRAFLGKEAVLADSDGRVK